MIGAGLPARSIESAYRKLVRIIKDFGSNYEGHFDKLCREYGVKDPAPIIAAGIVAYHELKVTMEPAQDAIPMLLSLIRNHFKLALITDGNPIKQWDKIHRLKIRPYFERIYVQDMRSAGGRKDAMIRQAIKDMGLRPEEVVFVGDKGKADMGSARRCGIYCVQVAGRGVDPKFVPDATISRLRELPRVIDTLVGC